VVGNMENKKTTGQYDVSAESTFARELIFFEPRTFMKTKENLCNATHTSNTPCKRLVQVLYRKSKRPGLMAFTFSRYSTGSPAQTFPKCRIKLPLILKKITYTTIKS